MASKTIDATWVKMRVGDELGLNETDLAGLYGIEVKALDKHLSTLAGDSQTIYDRVLSDVDSVRIGYRQIEMSDEQIQAIRELLANYPFHPLVSMSTADDGVGWRLSGDDAQWVAFRAADLVNLDFNLGEVLRLRLNRAVIWPDETEPEINQAFLDRVADVTFYLMELTGVV
jgi:hypothetical protein